MIPVVSYVVLGAGFWNFKNINNGAGDCVKTSISADRNVCCTSTAHIPVRWVVRIPADKNVCCTVTNSSGRLERLDGYHADLNSQANSSYFSTKTLF